MACMGFRSDLNCGVTCPGGARLGAVPLVTQAPSQNWHQQQSDAWACPRLGVTSLCGKVSPSGSGKPHPSSLHTSHPLFSMGSPLPSHPKPSWQQHQPHPCSISSPVPGSHPSLPAQRGALGLSLALLLFQEPGETQQFLGSVLAEKSEQMVP